MSDGYPIYGIWAYSSAMNNASAIKRMGKFTIIHVNLKKYFILINIVSSYVLRTTLSNGRTTLYDGGPTLTG
jgi:hypothetical protein